MASHNVTELLTRLNTSTASFLKFFTEKNLPEPTHDKGDELDPRVPLPAEIIAAREAATEASDELHHLLLGPLGLLLSSPGDTVDATFKWPGSEEPDESGYSLSHDTNENPFDVIKKDPKRQEQFIDAMSYSHLHSSYSMDHLISNYDFGVIGNGTIVDVGGSHGQVAIAIARKYPHVNCIVQDLPDTIAGLESRIPDELRHRITGIEHDFLKPQPVQGADIYLFRWILHDWSDKYCVKILQSLVPALKKGAKIVVNDICIPKPGQLGIAADRNLR
ncbi:MAG: hypothetical protein LQ340_003535 [Diploschistes diacapsis]|nr:MAG: hypothetical protein LQ340_003535 [Diploschistes diacapsis]